MTNTAPPWRVRDIAQSGIRVVFAEPYSRHPPGINRFCGVGIKRKGLETWEDLLDHEVKLSELKFDGAINSLGALVLPRMGMPPREPTEDMMQRARNGTSFASTGWFIYATVVKATDVFEARTIRIGHRKPRHPLGDDVVLTLPTPCAGETDVMIGKEYEFRTALPENDTKHDESYVKMENLYFIQLLPNEYPSYHFFAGPHDTPLPPKEKRDDRKQLLYFPGVKLSGKTGKRTKGVRSSKKPAGTPGPNESSSPTKASNPSGVKKKSTGSKAVAQSRSKATNKSQDHLEDSTKSARSRSKKSPDRRREAASSGATSKVAAGPFPRKSPSRSKEVDTSGDTSKAAGSSPKKQPSQSTKADTSGDTSKDSSTSLPRSTRSSPRKSPGRSRKRDSPYQPDKAELDEPQVLKVKKAKRKSFGGSTPSRGGKTRMTRTTRTTGV